MVAWVHPDPAASLHPWLTRGHWHINFLGALPSVQDLLFAKHLFVAALVAGVAAHLWLTRRSLANRRPPLPSAGVVALSQTFVRCYHGGLGSFRSCGESANQNMTAGQSAFGAVKF